MKKEKLIEHLQQLPEGVDVLIFDPKKNLNGQNADNQSSAGLYEKFDIHMLGKDDIGEGQKPFAVMSIPTMNEKDEHQDITCKCEAQEKHGETTVACCNHCGLPTEPWWTNITISDGEYKVREEQR